MPDILPPDVLLTHHVNFAFSPIPLPPQDILSEDGNPWMLLVRLNCVQDLAGLMERGLFWTTQNISSPSGQLFPWKEIFPGYERVPQLSGPLDLVRCWKIQEFPDRPIAEPRWTGSLVLYAWSLQTLTEFQLSELTRERIFRAWVVNSVSGWVFELAPKESGEEDIYQVSDRDPSDLWWLWPMESLAPGGSCGAAQPRTHIKSGRVEEEEQPAGKGYASQPDALRSRAGGSQVVDRALVVLMYSASIAIVSLSVVAVILAWRWDGRIGSQSSIADYW